jgi:hypothetical protein
VILLVRPTDKVPVTCGDGDGDDDGDDFDVDVDVGVGVEAVAAIGADAVVDVARPRRGDEFGVTEGDADADNGGGVLVGGGGTCR